MFSICLAGAGCNKHFLLCVKDIDFAMITTRTYCNNEIFSFKQLRFHFRYLVTIGTYTALLFTVVTVITKYW